MLRSAGIALVVVLGLLWFGLHGESAGGVPAAVVQPMAAAIPAGAGLRQEAVSSGLALRRGSVGPQAISAAPAVAQALAPAPAGEKTESSLRRRMREATSLDQASEAAWQLASIVSDPKERRQMLGAALAGGAVRGSDFERAGAILRALNEDPRASLQPLVRTHGYTAKANDSLWKLCNKTFPAQFGVSPEVGLVRLLNGLASDGLRVGQSLLVPAEPLTVRVDSRELGMVVSLGDVPVAAYRVGLGKEGRTPVGRFKVVDRQEDPTWFFEGRKIPFGDPENVLGTRWLGFEERPDAVGYGIHGTSEPQSIGRFESMGCVRMRNAEVEELFELVSRGTEVEIG